MSVFELVVLRNDRFDFYHWSPDAKVRTSRGISDAKMLSFDTSIKNLIVWTLQRVLLISIFLSFQTHFDRPESKVLLGMIIVFIQTFVSL